MFKLMAWLGVYVGTPSAVSYASLAYQDDFVVFFILSAAVGLFAAYPLLIASARKPGSGKP